jgi:polyhydroxyalkanoate synthase subunit PhaC
MGDKALENHSAAGGEKSRRRKNTMSPRNPAAAATNEPVGPKVAGPPAADHPDPAPAPKSPSSDPPAAQPRPDANEAGPAFQDVVPAPAAVSQEASPSIPDTAPTRQATPGAEEPADHPIVDPAPRHAAGSPRRSAGTIAGDASQPAAAAPADRTDGGSQRAVPAGVTVARRNDAPPIQEAPSIGLARLKPTVEAVIGRTDSQTPPAPPHDVSASSGATVLAEHAAPPSAMGAVDLERFSQNVARLFEEGGKALAAYLKPREEGQVKGEAEEITGVVRTLAQVVEYWLREPQRAIELQARLGTSYLDLWAAAVRRMVGEKTEPVAKPDPRDTRFADPEWSSNQFFDFVKQAYLLTANWADRLVTDAQGLDPHTRQKAAFYVRQIANAISPSNFVLTNPELLRETFASHAENLVRGMKMLTEDIEAGRGHLKIRQSDSSMFEVGRNLAMTPGKVIYQNDLMQLIQYSPTTERVLKRPVLIVPPWINKYYILDLRPEKSFVKWCVDQGLTVFVISWVNPDARLAKKSFEEYMREGPFEALGVIRNVTGEDEVHTIGYCVGGTLLAVTLAYLAAKGEDGVLSATFFAAQVDFTYAGDLLVFVDEEQVHTLERQMEERGFLEGEKMATAFNMLRSNDLIWPYVINNYLKGKAPFPFDLLYWNSDATRMPAANHSFYLRNCYLENKLTKGEMVVGGRTLELHKVKAPIYNLATREDHIAPARSVFVGSKFFGGPLRYVLAGSGHIAGVINPPALQKYCYWAGGPPEGTLDQWIQKAEQRSGSWWPDWLQWIKDQDPTEVLAREPCGGKLLPIEDAPGSYVKVRD